MQNLKSKDEIIPLIAKHHQLGISSLFEFYVGQDLKNVEMNVIYISQGGIGLPNKDYYTSSDKSEIYNSYKNYIYEVLTIAKIEDPKIKAESITTCESMMAKAMMTPSELRVPENTYNKFVFDDVDNNYKNLKLETYISQIGLQQPRKLELIVGQVDFFKQINAMLENVTLEEWKNYLDSKKFIVFPFVK